MRTVTSAWLTAAANASTRSEISASYQPVWVVEILSINLHYATRPIAFSRQRVLGDGIVMGNGAALGDYLPTYGYDIALGGIAAPQEQLTDDYTRSQVGGVTIGFLNQEGFLRDLDGVLLDNAIVRIRLGFVGLGYDDYLEIWRGVIDHLEDRLEVVTFNCLDQSLASYPTLDVPLSPQYFPATPQANKSRKIPLLLGRNTDVETIQISGAAQGSLAFALTSSADFLILKEFGAPFPTSGEIHIGTEISVTYSSRAYFTNPTNGLTSLRLNGLVRSGTPASHAVGEAVILQNPNYDYLIGYKIADLQNVRGAGAIIDPGDYTLIEEQANAPVSILRFTAAQSEPITVDINAGAVDDLNLIFNGGFEDGTLTGFTVGAGATAAVGSSSPAPQEGNYRASLEGDEDTYKDLYVEVDTVIGADYVLTFWRQDSDTNLLTNGGWEAGDVSGWTLGYNANTVYFGIADADEPFASPFPQQNGQQLLSFAADGRYALLVGPAPGRLSYQLTLVQDFSTSVSSIYAVSLRHVTQQITQFFGQGNTALFSTQISAAIFISLGTTTAPDSLISYRQVPFARVVFNGQGPLLVYATSPAYLFTATSTTTRLVLYCIGLGQPSPVGGGDILPPALLLDAIRAQNASEIDTANVGLQIGTSASPGSIVDEDLPAVYIWTQYSVRFRATDAITRITWRNRYTTAVARASYLDNIILQRVYAQGYNPVEQIRYILKTFTSLQIDEESFITAYDTLIAWRYGAVLFEPGDSRALLERMAEQCGCLLVETTDGVIKIVVRDLNRTTVFGFNASNIVKDSYSAYPERIDNVYTEIYVWFGAKTGGSTQASDFAASTYCNPETTTHPSDTTLASLCQAALMNYKRQRRLDVYADFIQDIFTANLLLTYLAQTRTVRHTIVEFQTWIDASHLERGDVIAVDDPRFPNGSTVLYDYEIVGIERPTPTNPYPRITARLLRKSGWAGKWEYLAYAIEIDGWSDAFDS